jgi:hypothetical protein
MLTKTVSPRARMKDATSGEIDLVFATLNVIDRDGDVILPGAIKDGASVVISAYGHESWKGKLPCGRGTIHEVDDELVCKATFFLDTSHGVDTFNTVKGLVGDGDEADLTEWSFSLQEVVATKGAWQGQRANIMSQIGRIKEVSPVLAGAGVNTRTLAVKTLKQLESSLCSLLHEAGRSRFPGTYSWVADYDIDAGFVVYCVEEYQPGEGYSSTMWQLDYTRTETAAELSGDPIEVHRTSQFIPKSYTFAEHSTTVMAEVAGLTARASEVMALRAEKGKTISDESVAVLDQLADALAGLKALLDSPAMPTNPPDDLQAEAERLYLQFVASSNGVTL